MREQFESGQGTITFEHAGVSMTADIFYIAAPFVTVVTLLFDTPLLNVGEKIVLINRNGTWTFMPRFPGEYADTVSSVVRAVNRYLTPAYLYDHACLLYGLCS